MEHSCFGKLVSLVSAVCELAGEEQNKEGREVMKERKSGWMLPGHSSRWCLKCSGGLFPLLSLLMSFLCSCVFSHTPCDGC